MARRAGSADLPLHSGQVPKWLADRMTRLDAVMSDMKPSSIIMAATSCCVASPIRSGSSRSAR
jgi:hypothetical protein